MFIKWQTIEFLFIIFSSIRHSATPPKYLPLIYQLIITTVIFLLNGIQFRGQHPINSKAKERRDDIKGKRLHFVELLCLMANTHTR